MPTTGQLQPQDNKINQLSPASIEEVPNQLSQDYDLKLVDSLS
jgi:hypothetical protein